MLRLLVLCLCFSHAHGSFNHAIGARFGLPHVASAMHAAPSIKLQQRTLPTAADALMVRAPRARRSSTSMMVMVPTAAASIFGPRWLSVLPPLVTLVASVALRQVILAMLLGIWSGALLLHGGNALIAMLRTFDQYFVGALASPEHAGVVLFTLILGGTIGLVQKSGGALGLSSLVRGFFTTRRKGLLSTISLGSLIFFDDYSSILIVGNSLRPLISLVNLSVEKFAFAAHVMGTSLASLSPVSSWVGLQIGYIAAVYEQIGWTHADPFIGFLQSLRFRFFPLSILSLLLVTTLTGRDFGPMRDAELAAAESASASGADSASASDAASAPASGAESVSASDVAGEPHGPLDPKEGTPLRAHNALLPFGMVMVASFLGMFFQGATAIAALPEATRPVANIVNALRYADSVTALLWGSVAGWLTSLGLVLSQKLLSLSESMEAWTEGVKDVIEPTLVLLLAWALGSVISDVGTAEFIASSLKAGLPVWSLPALISAICYVISFACGSSFGTMGIVFPLVGPLAFSIGGGDPRYLFQCFGATMGGAIFGNVCSPISDTTILTSLSTRCGLAQHVKTIIPYTALAGFVSIVFGDLAVGLGICGAGGAFALCTGALLAVQMAFGRRAKSGQSAAVAAAAAAATAPGGAAPGETGGIV